MGAAYPVSTPQESDEFDGLTMSPQWQWHADADSKWAYFAGPGKGYVRLYSYPVPGDHKNLFDVGNLLLQKTPADEFTVTTKLRFVPSPAYTGGRTGLIVMGLDYAMLVVENTPDGLMFSQVECSKADKGSPEKNNASVPVAGGDIWLRVVFNKGAVCNFSYSTDGRRFTALGDSFQAREGKWIGAKVGLFCTRPAEIRNDGGYAEVDWFRITKNQKR